MRKPGATELSSFFYQITEAPEMQVCSLVVSLNWRWSLDRTTHSVRKNHLRLPHLLCKYWPSWPGSDPTPALFDTLALRVSVPWFLGTQYFVPLICHFGYAVSRSELFCVHGYLILSLD